MSKWHAPEAVFFTSATKTPRLMSSRVPDCLNRAGSGRVRGADASGSDRDGHGVIPVPYRACRPPMLRYALDRRKRYAFVGSTRSCTGKPRASRPTHRYSHRIQIRLSKGNRHPPGEGPYGRVPDETEAPATRGKTGKRVPFSSVFHGRQAVMPSGTRTARPRSRDPCVVEGAADVVHLCTHPTRKTIRHPNP